MQTSSVNMTLRITMFDRLGLGMTQTVHEDLTRSNSSGKGS